MSQILMQLGIDAEPVAVYEALTTADGLAGWWSTRAEVPCGEGEVVKVSFPDAPFTWDLRIDQARPGELLVWRCVGGPPPWVGTTVRWALEPAPQGKGTRLLFDHVGWGDGSDEMVRIVTVGWARILDLLKAYAETGRPNPFASF